jgi:ATP-dependent protease ClpP protease subunit
MTQQNVPQQQPVNRSGFYLIENEADVVDVYINGEFGDIESHAEFFEKLRLATYKYETARFYISSPGGNASTCNNIIEIMKQFKFTITICLSYMASAGVNLWAEGNFRVVAPNAMVMVHRESFGFYGKVELSENLALCIKQIGEGMFEKCGEFLTSEEIEKAKLSEVYFPGSTLLERKFCVSYQDYMNRTTDVRTIGTVIINPTTQQLGLITPSGMTILSDVYLEIDEDPQAMNQYEWLLGECTPLDSADEESTTTSHQYMEDSHEASLTTIKSVLLRILSNFKQQG